MKALACGFVTGRSVWNAGKSDEKEMASVASGGTVFNAEIPTDVWVEVGDLVVVSGEVTGSKNGVWMRDARLCLMSAADCEFFRTKGVEPIFTPRLRGEDVAVVSGAPDTSGAKTSGKAVQ